MRFNILEMVKSQADQHYPMKFQALLEHHKKHNPTRELPDDFLFKAYEFAQNAHKGQLRYSGEPFFEHCYEVAKILMEWHMDIATIVAGLLHDVIEDTGITREDVIREFGEEIASLVEGETKISGISFSSRQERQASNYMKMLLSVARDIRVIIIKFADRLHNMRTIDYLPLIKQRRIAIETRDVYIPLAHRLGMNMIKSEMEDLVLKVLDPDAYRFLLKKIREKKSSREKYIRQFAEPIEKELEKSGIKAEIKGRPKNFFSIYGKMKKRQLPFEEIYDLLAIRIIVEQVQECYAVLGIVHQLYKPVQERFKDYIATPKTNGYQSIHTTVIGPFGRKVEIQIRTNQMDETAREGIAAHWRYKEGLSSEDEIDQYMTWLRDLVEVLQNESSTSREFMETLRIDLFKDEIFVFTPKGDLVQLPQGSTPVDFAFDVHTQVGYQCIGAKVNGRIVPLNTELKSGDTVEIITSENHKPSIAWLKFVKTTKAIGAIKKWIRKEQFQQSVKLGGDILEKEFRRLKMMKKLKNFKESYETLGFQSQEKMLAAIGTGEVTALSLINKLYPKEIEEKEIDESELEERILSRARKSVKGVSIQGIDNLMVSFSKCCNPIPGDEIIGFVSRGRGLIVHRSDCRNLPLLGGEQERLVEVQWNVHKNQVFIVPLKILAQERKHFLRDLTESISALNTNISSLECKVDEAVINTRVVLEVKNLKQLNRIINSMKQIPGIITIERQ